MDQRTEEIYVRVPELGQGTGSSGAGKSQYSWDELEELITDQLEDEKISEQEFETLMRRLMDIDCEL